LPLAPCPHAHHTLGGTHEPQVLMALAKLQAGQDVMQDNVSSLTVVVQKMSVSARQSSRFWANKFHGSDQNVGMFYLWLKPVKQETLQRLWKGLWAKLTKVAKQEKDTRLNSDTLKALKKHTPFDDEDTVQDLMAVVHEYIAEQIQVHTARAAPTPHTNTLNTTQPSTPAYSPLP
jgi:hypothetical protein